MMLYIMAATCLLSNNNDEELGGSFLLLNGQAFSEYTRKCSAINGGYCALNWM